MAKTKEPKSAGKATSEINSLKQVKNASVVKASQTPVAKAKKVAQEVAAKAVNGKKAKKVEPESSEEEDEDDSEESSEEDSEESSEGDSSEEDDSESEEESEEEKVAPKKSAPAANGKVNGTGKAAKKTATKDDDSEEDDSEDSESDSEEDDDSEESDSDEEEKPVVETAKNIVDKAVKAGKAVVNGVAKGLTKPAESDDEDDDEEDDSDDSDDSEEDSDDSDDSEESDEEEEKEAPSKKRKAEDEPVTPAKKSKPVVESNGSKNLFVGNLSWNIDDEWLLREFQDFGEIAGARVVYDKESGRSRGFGYVEFTDAANAAAALEAMKDAVIDGRKPNVDFSTPRADANTNPRERANKRAQSFGDSKNPESDTLFVGNISFGADENVIGEAFGAYGSIANIRLPTDQETGRPKGFGYITFKSVEDAKNAYENMMGVDVAGRAVRLDYATPRPERSGDSPRGGGRGGRGGGRGGRGGFGGRGGAPRGNTTNRGGFGDFAGKKQTF